MKFSLFSLIAIVFFSGIIFNAWLLWSRNQQTTAEIIQLRADSKILESELNSLSEIEQAQKYQIASVGESVSILERPEPKENPREFLKTFLLHVPESQEVTVQLAFESMRYGNRSGDFDSTESTRIGIPAGDSKLVVRFIPIANGKSKKPDWFLKILLNDQEVVSRKYIDSNPARSPSVSWNIYRFDPQKNYSAAEKLPEFLSIHPQSSKSAVKLSLVRTSQSGE